MYNQKIINRFSKKEYLEILRDPSKLKEIEKDYLNRYHEYDEINGAIGKNILLKEAIDHFVLKNISLTPTLINSIEIQNYISYIKSLCARNSLEYNINVIFRTTNPISSKFPTEQLKVNNSKIDILYQNIKSGKIISEQDLDFIAKWIIGNLEKEEYLEIFLTYILNTHYQDDNKKVSFPVIQAIASASRIIYCKLLLKDEPNELKEEFLSLRTTMSKYTRKRAGNNFSGRGVDTPIGTFFSPKYYKSMSLIPNSKQTHSRDSLVNTDIGDFFYVLGHEYTHCIQRMKKTDKEYSFRGIQGVIAAISRENYSYDIYHDSFMIEIDSDSLGWDFCSRLLERYSRKLYLKYHTEDGKNIFIRHKGSINTRYNFGKINNEYLQEIELLVKTVEANPEELFTKYPMLRELFDEHGQPDVTRIIKLNHLDQFQLLFLKYLIIYYKNKDIIISTIKKEIYENKDNVNIYSKIIRNLYHIHTDNRTTLSLIEKALLTGDYGDTSSLGVITELKARFAKEKEVIEELILNIMDNNRNYDYLNNMFISSGRKLK